MGQKKHRLAHFAQDIKKIVEYVRSYQYSLRALFSTVPEDAVPAETASIVAIGKCEIWPCSDGAAVLIYEDPGQEISIDEKPPLSGSIDKFMDTGEAAAMYDAVGRKCPYTATIQMGDMTERTIMLAGNKIIIGSSVFTPKYRKAFLVGWQAQLPAPDVQAKIDLDHVFVSRNVLGEDARNKPAEVIRELTLEKLAALLNEAQRVIDSAENEEEIQRFLAAHPEIIYPEYIHCYPKYKLGKDYVTDFVFQIHGNNGPEYVFVELEKASKKIFVASGQFSAEYTQAKDQLTNWESWLTEHLTYAKVDLPGLFNPRYHLIMGRSDGIDENARKKIRLEFQGTTKHFSTYDDVINRFKAIIERLRN